MPKRIFVTFVALMLSVELAFSQECNSIFEPINHGNEIIFAQVGCIEIASIPQPSPGDGLAATKIQIRTVDPEGLIVTFDEINISNAQQVWPSGGLEPRGGTALGKPSAGPLYHADWIAFDSHLLISQDMIGGGIYYISESNNGSAPSSLPVLPNGVEPRVGFGDITTQQPEDAFFLRPELWSNSIDLAYVVSDGARDVELSLAVLGTGFVDAWKPNGAYFGFGGIPAVEVPFAPVPEPNSLATAVTGLLLFVGWRCKSVK